MNDSLIDNHRQVISRSMLAAGDLAAIPLGQLIGPANSAPRATRPPRSRLSPHPVRALPSKDLH